jgi:tripartite-type tricarboxylate transporter receptor subunit TctC
MKISRYLGVVLVFGAAMLLSGCGGSEESAKPNTPDSAKSPASTWPKTPVSIVCEGAAGGVNDLFCRVLAIALTADLGVAVEVTNKDSAVDDVWAAAHDGMRWAAVSDAMLVRTNVKAADWSFHVIARAPAVISVPAKSRNKLQTLVRESKREESDITVAASGEGGLWHSKLIGLGTAAKTSFKFNNFPGEGPSKLAALSGQVSAVLSSIGDQAAEIQSGKLKPLGMVEGEAFELRGFGEITSVTDFYPDVANDPVSRFVGIAVPADVPAEVQERIGAAFAKAMSDPALKSLANEEIWQLDGAWGAGIGPQMAAAAERRSADLQAIADAKREPSDGGQ